MMCHVLIIEDEALVALNIQLVLEEHGASTFALADTEEEAVAAALAHRPDVITSDVRLRHGSGPQAVKSIHERMGDIPVIFITGSPAACTPCEPPGVVLIKPLDEAAIATAFRNVVNKVS